MAGVSTKEIKSRIRSMESTRQITRAMEMVASAKLRKTQMQITDGIVDGHKKFLPEAEI